MINDEYDSPWKEAVVLYFPEFMGFYFPAAYAEIDWTQEYVFLDKELRAVVRDAQLGKRFVDKLVRVTLLSGGQKWVYIHIEVQGSKQADFALRMFVYNYRLFDKYNQPIASMAVLADDNAKWKPTAYGFEVLGCEHSLKFPVAKLTDYRDKIEELLVLDNAFALITVAHILTQRTKHQDDKRFAGKLRLIRLLYQRNWSKQRIIKLFSVVDWLMALPEDLEQQIWHEIETIEGRENMRYITSVERIGIKKGMERGMEKGMEKGIAKGRLQGEAGLLRKQLEFRFGELPSWVNEQLSGAKEQELESWAKALFSAASLEAVFVNGAAH